MVKVDGRWAEFQFYRPHAKEVSIVGDFNGWRPGELRMVRADSGHWSARVRLECGRFRFRYLADGQWYTDYAAFGVQAGPFGFDGVVKVK